jgi:phenylacetate-CoA ligase
MTPVLPGQAESVPTGPGDLKFQRWLQDSQWWSADRHLDHQLQLLRRLVAHAHGSVAFHRERIDAAGIDPELPFTLAEWQRLPILSRRDLQPSTDKLASDSVPGEHGDVLTNTSSGSTGTPVSVRGTTFDAWVFKALVLRHYLWHPHDFTGKLVTIRHVDKHEAEYPAGATYQRWGDTATFPFATGPSAALSITASIAEQAEWLARQDAVYLMSYPSNLLGLAEYCMSQGIDMPSLEHVAAFGEVVNAEVRDAVRQAWDAPLIDVYSAQEVGVIADQCPKHNRYHVAAESILVEVVDTIGKPCAPGTIGRVLVTPLFNYAMPLLRYEIGDYAELGRECDCGRGLPVLERVLGRERNALLVTLTGERYWPSFGSRTFTSIAPIIQHQFIQKDLASLEARLVVERPLTTAEEDRLKAHIQSRLPCPFAIDFAYPTTIPRNAGGKFENFVSDVAIASRT